jgi:hypothetical protein
MEFFILKGGRIHGPFTGEQLETHLRDGRFSAFDLAQTGRTPRWTAIAKLIEIELGPNDRVRPDWQARARNWAFQIRNLFETDSLRVGIYSLGTGAVLLILARWPALLCGPWFFASAIAGCILLARGKVIPGLALCLATLALPITIWLLLFAPSGAFR